MTHGGSVGPHLTEGGEASHRLPFSRHLSFPDHPDALTIFSKPSLIFFLVPKHLRKVLSVALNSTDGPSMKDVLRKATSREKGRVTNLTAVLRRVTRTLLALTL